MGGSRLRIGLVVDGTDHFIRPIETELRRRHRVDRFAPRFVRLPLIGRRVNDWFLLRQLTHFLDQNDVVFFEWAGTLLAQTSQARKHGRIVARLHSVELATSVEQINWRNVDHLIVLNNHLLGMLQSIVPSKQLPQVSVIPNGVDLLRFGLKSRGFHFRLGMVCNLLPVKRVYEVVLCLYELRRAGYPFTLRIAGTPGGGEARRYVWALDSLVRKLNLADVVSFDGYVGNVADWLADTDVFISNSYWEGQQVALLEAMAAGCYCLSHCWDGVEEILPCGNTFMTDSELRAKLIWYAALPSATQQAIQRELRTVVEDRFDERRMVARIVDLVELTVTG